MSLPWSNEVHLHVAPHGISGVLARSWPTPRRIAAATSAADVATPPTADQTPQLDDHQLDAVLDELEQSASVRGLRYRAELADVLVHFDVAEGAFGTMSDRELQVIADACIAELLGDDAANHEVRWNLQTGGRHLFIAAVPKPCLMQLTSAAKRRDARLESVEPAFCRQWNAFARLITSKVGIFAVTSGSHAVVACVVAGAVCGVSVGPWTQTVAAAMAARDVGTEPPSPTETSLLLARRSTRLFTSLGIDLDSDPQFVLVTPDPAAMLASPPWTVVQALGEWR